MARKYFNWDPRQPLPAHAKPADHAVPTAHPTPGIPFGDISPNSTAIPEPIDGPTAQICPHCRHVNPIKNRRCEACKELMVAKTVDDSIHDLWTAYRGLVAANKNLRTAIAAAEDPARKAKHREECEEIGRRTTADMIAKMHSLGFDGYGVLEKGAGVEVPR